VGIAVASPEAGGKHGLAREDGVLVKRIGIVRWKGKDPAARGYRETLQTRGSGVGVGGGVTIVKKGLASAASQQPRGGVVVHKTVGGGLRYPQETFLVGDS